MQCDKHVVKMIIESAQMLSTAHRLLDGKLYFDRGRRGQKIKRWLLPDDRENLLYKASHVNHPCNIWCRENSANYMWLYNHFCALCDEYTYRYNKIHASDKLLRDVLSNPPDNIKKTEAISLPALAMDESCKVNLKDPVDCYRKYYIEKQRKFDMHWTNRAIPSWFHFDNENYLL